MALYALNKINYYDVMIMILTEKLNCLSCDCFLKDVNLFCSIR